MTMNNLKKMKKIVFAMAMLAVLPIAAQKKVVKEVPMVIPTSDNVLTEQEEREGVLGLTPFQGCANDKKNERV